MAAGIFGRRTLQESGALRGGTDRHSHILFGVDDGIGTVSEALSVLAYQELLGVNDVWCTPHIMEDVPNGTEMLRARFSELCALYSGPVHLHLAAEYMLDSLFVWRFRERDLLPMEDDMLLLETSCISAPYDFQGILSAVMSAGYRPLLAHPERYVYLKMTEYEQFRKMGVRFQLNLPSLTGYYGKEVRSRAETLLQKGMYFAYGSDCHNANAIRRQYGEAFLSRDVLKRVAVIGCDIRETLNSF